MKEFIERLIAIRGELDALIAEATKADAIERIDKAQASVPETKIGGGE